ncbi:MAG: thiamine phosphate synthase [Beijerinckiaceae bacterium]|nr:thiamine phosphate synthase [Beijerinckiaceae bacterium]MCI0736581.1 thiamine phosphate synthase [Beijerinckiaceae bacterium]
MVTNAPRLYLITPPISDWTPYPPLLKTVIPACGVACLLIRTATLGEDMKANIFDALAPLAQEQGAACLVADDPQLALRVNADGVHINGEGQQLESALRALKPGRIVGAGGLRTRHGAMAAGEAGADYVLFGDRGETHSAIVERAAWWAEIFTVPCAGYAHDLGSIRDLILAGADFVALGDAVFKDPRGAGAALHDAATLVAATLETSR